TSRSTRSRSTPTSRPSGSACARSRSGEPPDRLDVVDGDLVDARARRDAHAAGEARAVVDALGEAGARQDAHGLARPQHTTGPTADQHLRSAWFDVGITATSLAVIAAPLAPVIRR